IALLSGMSADTTYSRAVVNIVVTGFGLGVTMPLYTIAVQNTVPYKLLGVATSSTAFFRSIGGSIGLAVFGSIMNNRFTSEFTNGLPIAAKAIIPPEILDSLAHNPQALVSPDAQAQLKDLFNQLGSQGTSLYEQVLHTLRVSLDTALSHVFFIAIFMLAAAFIINLFIREIPLRKQNIEG
ncbi:MFS transporter, partial [Chloroflexota bacterium]